MLDARPHNATLNQQFLRAKCDYFEPGKETKKNDNAIDTKKKADLRSTQPPVDVHC